MHFLHFCIVALLHFAFCILHLRDQSHIPVIPLFLLLLSSTTWVPCYQRYDITKAKWWLSMSNLRAQGTSSFQCINPVLGLLLSLNSRRSRRTCSDSEWQAKDCNILTQTTVQLLAQKPRRFSCFNALRHVLRSSIESYTFLSVPLSLVAKAVLFDGLRQNSG